MFGSLSKNFKGSAWNAEQTAVNYRLCSQRYLCYAGSKKHRRAKPFAAARGCWEVAVPRDVPHASEAVAALAGGRNGLSGNGAFR